MSGPRKTSERGKRILDVTLTLLALILTVPLFLIVSMAIRLDSPGPILFRQQRVGRHGQAFWIYKFRTMFVGSSAGPGGAVIEDKPVDPHDPSITRVGWLLRALSLDELPQLLNVLAGDMSLVGPRPTIPAQVAKYTEVERQRLEVLPGITGLAQISGRNNLDWPARIRLDIDYVRSRSMALDLSILLRTVFYVLRPWGIYHRSGASTGTASN